nr:MAG TPA: hypothetical protein [Caudoviricetes sp.]
MKTLRMPMKLLSSTSSNSENNKIYKDWVAPLQAYWMVAFNMRKPMST